MGFLAPLALAFAALGIPIIVLSMLKRRRDVLVSSTLLWQRLLRDREANAPWQRLSLFFAVAAGQCLHRFYAL